MSIPQSYFIETTVPDGTTDRVLKMENLPFRALTLPVDMPQEESYSFSVWLKCSAAGSVDVALFGNIERFEVGTSWQRITMVANSRTGDTVTLTVRTNDRYLIYRAMLESGNKPGDWSPSPEDGEESIAQIQQSLIQLTPQNIILTVMSSDEMGEVEGNISALGGRVTTAEGNITSLGGRVTGVEGAMSDAIEYGVPKVRSSSVLIDADGITMESTGTLQFKAGTGASEETAMTLSEEGIEMNTPGTVNIHAKDTGGSIIFGTDVENAVFSVSDQGQLHAVSVDADRLSQGGVGLPQIVISQNRPQGNNILWLLPTSTTERNWVYDPGEGNYNLNVSGGLGKYRDYFIPYARDEYMAGDKLFYGINVTLYCYALSPNPKDVTLKASLIQGSKTIVIGQNTVHNARDGSYVLLDVMMAEAADNVMSEPGGSFTLRLETNATSGVRLQKAPFTLKARTTAAAGVSACSVFFIQ